MRDVRERSRVCEHRANRVQVVFGIPKCAGIASGARRNSRARGKRTNSVRAVGGSWNVRERAESVRGVRWNSRVFEIRPNSVRRVCARVILRLGDTRARANRTNSVRVARRNSRLCANRAYGVQDVRWVLERSGIARTASGARAREF